MFDDILCPRVNIGWVVMVEPFVSQYFLTNKLDDVFTGDCTVLQHHEDCERHWFLLRWEMFPPVPYEYDEENYTVYDVIVSEDRNGRVTSVKLKPLGRFCDVI